MDSRKIAAIGLRVRHGCTYHGIAVNVDADLAPFRGIDPCGYAGLEVTRLRDLGIVWTVRETGERLVRGDGAPHRMRGFPRRPIARSPHGETGSGPPGSIRGPGLQGSCW